MKTAIELAREAGWTEFGMNWSGIRTNVEKLITLTRADMLADLLAVAGEPKKHRGIGPGPDTWYTHEQVAAAVAHAKNYGECDECGTPYSHDPTDGGTICVHCQNQRIASLESQLAAARQQGEQLIDCLEYGGRIFGDRSNPPKLLEVMAWLQSSKSAIDAAIRAAGGVE